MKLLIDINVPEGSEECGECEYIRYLRSLSVTGRQELTCNIFHHDVMYSRCPACLFAEQAAKEV